MGVSVQGHPLDEVDVQVAAPNPACATKVDHVVYALHPTFSNPNPTVDGLAPLTLRTWGHFDGGATIVLEDGSLIAVRGRVAW